MSPLLTTLRFSPRPNRASEVHWHEWGPEAFREAERRDAPILLHLTAAWCHWCHIVDETTLSDPQVITLLNESLVPVRVDTDRHPHVRDRYIAGGWPTTAFLTPDGEVLWSGTGLEAHELLHVARGVLRGWQERRGELASEVERRRMAIQASGRRHAAAGLLRRESADSVLAALIDCADARNGGFGEPPRFPAPDAVELLFTEGLRRGGDPQCAALAERHLDGILAGELFDRVDGGFFRYALQADWTEPQYEKLLAVNGALVRIYALGARLEGRSDWRDVAEATIEWADSRLLRKDGLWGASQDADPAFYALDPADRSGRHGPAVDATVYTDANAAWICGLAVAGARLGQESWIGRAAAALDVLDSACRGPAGRVLHVVGDPASAADLLTDLVGLARACLAVAQATGDRRWLDRAGEIVARMHEQLTDEDGGFRDLPSGAELLGALRYRDRPFDLNADVARLVLDLATATGDRSYRAMAERILAVLSSTAPRFGAAAAGFALAMGDFFDSRLGFYIVGAPGASSALRCAATALPEPGLRVWTLDGAPAARAVGVPAEPAPAAYAFRGTSRSAAVTDPDALATAADSLR